MQQFSLAIHGGAGTILKEDMTAELERAYLNGLDDALAAALGPTVEIRAHSSDIYFLRGGSTDALVAFATWAITTACVCKNNCKCEA